MRASVVVPSREGAGRLGVLLAALARQTYPDVEVVLVLDGDVDGSRAVAEDWHPYLNLHIIEFPTNQGRVAALNAGFQAATGEVLIRCDDDLDPHPQHVQRHVDHHLDLQHPVGAIGLCPNVFPDTAYARMYGRSWDSDLRRLALDLPGGQQWRLWGANVSVTRATWERVGPYDDAYQGYGLEDVDWGFRLHELNIPIELDTGLDALHRGPATTTVARVHRAVSSGAASRTFAALHGDQALSLEGAAVNAWGRIVRAAGHRLSPSQVCGMAHLADRVIEHVPSGIGRKLIAFAVETAAVTGRERGAA